MKILRYALLSLILATPAYARPPEWRLAGDNVASIIYLDMANIARGGTTVAAWELTDFKQPNAFHALSMVSNFVYDCQNGTIEQRFLIAYDEHMAHGKIISSGNYTGPPELILPGSMGDIIKEYLCHK